MMDQSNSKIQNPWPNAESSTDPDNRVNFHLPKNSCYIPLVERQCVNHPESCQQRASQPLGADDDYVAGVRHLLSGPQLHLGMVLKADASV